jgi:hypothetical protein
VERGKWRRAGHWIEIVRFWQQNIDGAYFSEADYLAIYPFSPTMQSAFDVLDKALSDARDEIGDRLTGYPRKAPSFWAEM